MSFEGQQQKVEHDGSRKKFSAHISMVWAEEKLMAYDFYDEMNSTSTIDHLEEQKTAVSENLGKTFGRWYGDFRFDTNIISHIISPFLFGQLTLSFVLSYY
jgi:hypothetical protein